MVETLSDEDDRYAQTTRTIRGISEDSPSSKSDWKRPRYAFQNETQIDTVVGGRPFASRDRADYERLRTWSNEHAGAFSDATPA